MGIFNPGDKAIVKESDADRMIYNVDGQMYILRPGDEVTILGCRPEDDDDDEEGDDGLAYLFSHPRFPAGDYSLHGIMIKPEE